MRLQTVLGTAAKLALAMAWLMTWSGDAVLAADAQERQAIHGQVVDQSGAPIAGATVTLRAGSQVRARTTTTAAGEFILTAPAAGPYVLTVAQSLFEPAQLDVTIADGAPAPEPRVVLTVAALREQVSVVAAGAKPLQLDAVSDAGSRLGLTNRETPATIEFLSQARMQELGARTTVETLNRSAGVTFSLTPNGPVRLNMRGFSSDAVSVLHDGIRATASGAQSRNQDNWLFDRIEVLNGPASVLYGEGALAGVINFVPKRPLLGKRAFAAVVSGGSLETGRLAADLNLPIGDKVAVRAIASGNRTAGYVDDTDAEFLTGSLGLRAQPTARLTIDLGVDHSGDELKTAYYGTPLVPAGVARDPVAIVQTPSGLVFDRALQTSNLNVENAGYGADTTIARSQVRYRVNDAVTVTNLVSYYDSRHRFLDNAINFAYVPATGLVTRARSTVVNDFEFWAARPVVAVDTRLFGRRNRFSIGGELSRLTASSFRRLGASHPPLDPYAPVRGLAPGNDPPSAFPTAATESSTVDIAAAFLENALNLTDR